MNVFATEKPSVAMVAGLHLIVTAGTSSFASDIAEYLGKNEVQFPGVIGPDIDAEQFAKKWCDQRNCQMKLTMSQRVYELRQIRWPKRISGRARLITASDVSLLAAWLEGFYLETIPWELPNKEKILQGSEARISQEMTFFWEDDGHPVCMAALSRPSARGITVNAVYTPPENRRQGLRHRVGGGR